MCSAPGGNDPRYATVSGSLKPCCCQEMTSELCYLSFTITDNVCVGGGWGGEDVKLVRTVAVWCTHLP